jgi:carbon storage regulator
MLVLSRKVGERIHVGDDIVLEVRRISGNRVTLALEAPRHVRILRGELERAAREFDPPLSGPTTPMGSPKTPRSTVAAARLNVLEHLPAPAVERDFAI